MITDLYVSNAMLSCNCNNNIRKIPMLTTGLTEVVDFPVEVFDINGISLGFASTKAQYISIWNSSSSNSNVGVLKGDYYPFVFTIVKVNGPLPQRVLGNPVNYIPKKIITQTGGKILATENGKLITI